ncbi:MAG: SMP-30/gluconolactonase/LRE family protein [Burkholderiales bacterium]|uniref:SMP-30/gluconolactonase/LRE family protein n=2 Tax=Pseudomonadota TaxID=1224 RepID=UPI000FA8AE7D|nr:MAG: SMP-30/gluconolactonase/LRE family protein [Burkholderiales bacterium]
MASAYDIQPLGRHRCLLGESPLWHPDEQVLYCVDIPGRQILRWTAGSDEPEVFAQDAEPGCIAARAGGGLVVARRDGLWAMDTRDGGLTALAGPPYDPSRQRYNDGKPDAAGRWWVGALSDAREPEAALYRITPAGAEPMLGGIVVSNGLAWSPDGTVLYRSDTKAHTIWAHAFDLHSGTLGEGRVFASFAPRTPDQPLASYGGRPDGAAVDESGAYWVAMFEGAQLLRYAADGVLLEVVPLPVRCPTMPAFGGADGRTLFITTARDKRPADELAREPWAGAVLSLRVAVPGLPAQRCRL